MPGGEPPDLAGVRHQYIDAGGLRMHVALAGPEDGSPVLLVHGWPQNWWVWREVIPALAETHRVIAPDLRGHGWSEAPAAGYEKEELASDLLALVDALQVPEFTYVGHDWGGWVGFLAALRAPERFQRMLALCIPHPWTAPSLSRTALMLGYQGPLSLPLVGRRVARPMLRALVQSGRGDHKLSVADLNTFADHTPPAVTVAMYRTALTRELLPIARGRYANAELQVATTLMLGSEDLISRGTPAGPVASQPELSVEIVDGVGHWLPEQRPQAVIDWVRG